ncbi:MAG: lysophospholipid acyltransferase family protein [bacterium]
MSPWYRFIRALAYALARLLWGLRVDGRENLPSTGPAIVACNHVSNLDPPILGAIVAREAGFVAKQELFAVPGLGWLIRSLNAIPIDRSRLSRETLDTLVEFLDGGRVLILFPEGTRSRSGDLLPAKPGVGMLLVRRPVTVIPAYIEGTRSPLRNVFRRGRIRVVFGRPHALPQDAESDSQGRRDPRRIAESILDAIRRVRDEVTPQGAGSPGTPEDRARARSLRADELRIRDEGTEPEE